MKTKPLPLKHDLKPTTRGAIAPLSALVALAAISMAPNATAQLITESFTGTVTSSLLGNTTSDDTYNLFGVGGGSLLGLPVTLTYTLNPAGITQSAPFYSGPNLEEYYTPADPTDVLTVTLTINSHTISIGPDLPEGNYVFRDDVGLLSSVSDGSASLSANFLTADSFDFDSLLTQAGNDALAAGIDGVQLGYSSSGPIENVNIGSVAAVPEPSSVLLLAASLTGFGAIRRRRA